MAYQVLGTSLLFKIEQGNEVGGIESEKLTKESETEPVSTLRKSHKKTKLHNCHIYSGDLI